MSGTLGVRSDVSGTSDLTLSMTHVIAHNGCAPTHSAGGEPCPHGPGQLGDELRFRVAVAESRDGPFTPIWTGHAAGLGRGVAVTDNLHAGQARWILLSGAASVLVGQRNAVRPVRVRLAGDHDQWGGCRRDRDRPAHAERRPIRIRRHASIDSLPCAWSVASDQLRALVAMGRAPKPPQVDGLSEPGSWDDVADNSHESSQPVRRAAATAPSCERTSSLPSTPRTCVRTVVSDTTQS